MSAIPLEHGLAVAGILFCLGLVGLMVRKLSSALFGDLFFTTPTKHLSAATAR